MVPNENDENKSTDAMETVLQASSTRIPEEDTAVCTETDVAVLHKKSARGRKPKVVCATAAEHEEDAKDDSQEPVVPAPVRGRRGKKTEATAPSAVRQTTRSRNVKSQESTVQEEAVKTVPVLEVSDESVSDQSSAVNDSQEENSAPIVDKTVVKPKGRKTKEHAGPLEPKKEEDVSDQQPTVGKTRRGRQTKTDAAVQNEVSEDAVVPVEMKQQTQPGIRAKRGRNANREEEKLENDSKTLSIETNNLEEPVKKSRRTRNADHDKVEATDEETSEAVLLEEDDASVVAAPVKTKEQSTVTSKPRRGGRKMKEGTESKTVESTEIQEVSAVISTDKSKRGRRGKQVTEEAGVPEVGMATELSQAIPAKRARRGAALPIEDIITESAVPVPESASTSVEPIKRGRRAAAKTITSNAAVSSSVSDELNSDVKENAKTSKKSVKFKSDLEVFEMSQATPVKAVRGRKSKLGDRVEAESKSEEKDLSDKVVETQPIKRARRGAKVTDKVDSSEKLENIDAEAEMQPKTRRGRSAKK